MFNTKRHGLLSEEKLNEDEIRKLDHIDERYKENAENVRVSMVGHLSALNDGIIAIFITVMMLEIPFPSPPNGS